MNIFKKIRNFWYNLSRSTKWFVRMWSNHDYDDFFLIQMIVYKMEDMRFQFDVRDKWFVDLRHQPDKFHSPNDKSYNIIDCLDGLDKSIDLGNNILKGDYIHYTPEVQSWFDTHNFLKDKMPDDIRNQYKEIMDNAEKEEQQDRKNFFNIIRDNHQMWWS